MTEPLIAADDARCNGDGEAGSTCQDCARRLQLERDDESRWYPHMFASPVRGSCIYKLTASPNTQEKD